MQACRHRCNLGAIVLTAAIVLVVATPAQAASGCSGTPLQVKSIITCLGYPGPVGVAPLDLSVVQTGPIRASAQ